MKQVLFATSNQTKAKRFRKGLLEKGIETLTLKDINIKLDVEENGKTAIENALIKARAYYEKTHIPTIGMDDTLYIENIDDNLQPGLFVRRVNGKTLNDEEMITYYTNLVKKYGVNGRLNCKWIYGLAFIDDEGKESTYTWYKDNFYMVDVPSKKIDPGYPLNSISKYKQIDKYFTDITDKDKKLIDIAEDDVIKFIEQNLLHIDNKIKSLKEK